MQPALQPVPPSEVRNTQPEYVASVALNLIPDREGDVAVDVCLHLHSLANGGVLPGNSNICDLKGHKGSGGLLIQLVTYTPIRVHSSKVWV